MIRFEMMKKTSVAIASELVMLLDGIIFADMSSQDASFILNCVCTV